MTYLQLPNLEIIEKIGQGGMASVYRAKQLSLDRDVAVKILSDKYSSQQCDIRRFLQESKACARFQHNGLVRVYDANVVNNIYYFVMELISGYTMNDLMLRKKTVAAEDLPVILEAVANALCYAWNKHNVVHCDIKPDNIMVDADGSIKVTDLGIAHSILGNLEDSEEVMGTPAYMSPEQIYGTKDLDCRADIYSLGATLYHLGSGRILFPSKTDEDLINSHIGAFFAPDIRCIIPEISPSFSLILNRMLAKQRDLRYPDWETLLVDVEHFFNNEKLIATPLGPTESSMSLKKN